MSTIFPRIKEFEFDFETTFKVPSHLVGKLHRIAYELYGSVSYYRPLAAANGIRMNMGSRVGLRPMRESLLQELKNDGYSDADAIKLADQTLQETRTGALDWLQYSDVTYGYVSDVTEGRLLMVPRKESAKEYLDNFDFIKGKNL